MYSCDVQSAPLRQLSVIGENKGKDFANMINSDCDSGEEYPFLKVYEPEGEEHYEVTKEAMTFVHNYYNYYKQNYKEPEERSQMTTAGWSISKKEPYKDKAPYKGKEKPCINVVADVFTTPNAFSKDLKNADGMALLKYIYHTVGNFIPIPEGANFRPGKQGKKEIVIIMNLN